MKQTREPMDPVLLWAAGVTVALAFGVGMYMVTGKAFLGLVGVVAGFAVFAAIASAEYALWVLIVVACLDGLVKGLVPGTTTLLFKDAVLGIALVHWLWGIVNRAPRPSLTRSVALPAFIFVLYCAAEMFNSETLSWLLALAGLRSWVIWIPVFFIAHDVISTRRQLDRMLVFLALIGAATAIYGVIQHRIGFEHLYELSSNFSFYQAYRQGASVRAVSTYVNPATFGIAMTFTGIVTAGGALASRMGSFRQLLLVVCGLVCAVGMAVTGSRAPLLGAIAGLIVFVLMTRRPQIVLALVILAGLGGWQASHYVDPMLSVRYSERFLNPETVARRIRGPFEKGLKLMSRYPLGTGVASGTGAGRIYAYIDKPLAVKRGGAAAFVENEFGRALKELGLPGTAAYLWLLWRVFGAGIRGGLRSKGQAAWAACGLVAGSASIAVQLLGGSVLYLAPGGIYFWLALALASRMPEYEEQEMALLEERTAEQEQEWEEMARRTEEAT